MAQQSPRSAATIIWAALLAGPTAFLGVALYLVVGLRGGTGLNPALDETMLAGGSLALSVVTVGLSWLWAVRMRITRPAPGSARPRRAQPPFPPGPEADAVARLIVACALCEGGALAALIVFMQTGSQFALATYAFSWLALAAHFPGDRHWARLVGASTATR
jgi:hypothetical protein